MDAHAGTRLQHALPADMGALTSLRALLAWWVVLFHLAPLEPFRLQQSAGMLGKGPVLVDCFFLLSGFVLFHVHPRILHRPDRRRAVASFLLARVARLYPIHLVMLAAFVALLGGLRLAVGFHPNDASAFSGAALIEQVLLLHGFALPTGEAWNFPSWSISSECVAYALAPLLFRGILAASRPLLLLCGCSIAGLVICGIESGQLSHFAWVVPRVTGEFALGALLRLLAGHAFSALCRVRHLALASGWCALPLLAASNHAGLFFAAMAWLILFLSLTPGWHGRLGAIARYLGETSYAVYMCHAFVLLLWGGLASRLHPSTTPFLVVGICVAVQASASLLHHLVERPARSAIRVRASRWLDRPRGEEGQGSALDPLKA